MAKSAKELLLIFMEFFFFVKLYFCDMHNILTFLFI